jgi:cytosolic carboxypeptidase protein 6
MLLPRLLPRLFPGLLLGVAACASAGAPARLPEAPTPATPPPAAADFTITADRTTAEVHRRTVPLEHAGAWLSNELDGGWFGDVRIEADSLVVVQVRPENAPVNNSAWYAFKAWSHDDREVVVRLSYEDGTHRYWPVVRRRGGPWTPLDSALVSVDSARAAATLRLRVGPDTLWVAGQELMTSAHFRQWTDSLAAQPHVERDTIGRSVRGRPLHLVRFGAEDATRHVVIIGRLHPPEITGSMALVPYVEELAGDSPLAVEFRRHFQVHVVPLVNPDGVDLGYWRHNVNGVDLNRDWVAFHQPETRAVRDEVRRIMAQPGAELWFGVDFHSTHYDVFYTLDRSLQTRAADITDRWLAYITDALPHYSVRDSPSGLTTATSRNWFHREFGAPALIYEVGDTTDRALIREVARTAARGTMEVLLDELKRGAAAH